MAEQSLKTKVLADGYEITIRQKVGQTDYISLTDIAKRDSAEPNAVIQNWMRNRATIEYLGLWESMFNPNFNPIDFEGFRAGAGSNSFTMSPKKWIEATNAIGMESKAGRYGGTFAHYDIALEFMSWISPAYKLYFLMEYQRLKGEEAQRQSAVIPSPEVFLLPGHNKDLLFVEPPPLLEWDPAYDALEDAELIHVAIFGITQGQFEKRYPAARGLIHNHSSINHIVTHASLCSRNRDLLAECLSKRERFQALNRLAVEQVTSLAENGRNQPQLPEPERPVLPEDSAG